MRPYYQDDFVTLYHGDCRDILPQLDAPDLVFTSPPYAQQRDYTVGKVSWDELVPPAYAALRRISSLPSPEGKHD